MSHQRLYRCYVDEVGNHDMEHADDPSIRFLSLSGVIVERCYYVEHIQPDIAKLKRQFFFTDPDEPPPVFVRKKLVNARDPFRALRNKDIRHQFDHELLRLLSHWQYRVVTIVIDKKAHRGKYARWHYHPYHYCLQALLERFVWFLRDSPGPCAGDILVEARGGEEDHKLKELYTHLYDTGTDLLSAGCCREYLTSRQLKVKPKKADIAGLQLADLIAHPSRREVLLRNGLIEDKRDIFGDRICRVLRLMDKYLRDRQTDTIEGCGTTLLP